MTTPISGPLGDDVSGRTAPCVIISKQTLLHQSRGRDPRCRGLKLHMLYDPRAAHPVHFAVQSPKISEIRVARTFVLEPNATSVFDKGYTDYGWWQSIVDAGAIFVTRLKSNVYRRHIRANPPAGETIQTDQKLRIGNAKPRGGAINRLHDTELREIVVT